MNTEFKNKHGIHMLILFVIAFLPRIIMILVLPEPLRTPMDEMSTMSTAALVSGLDWTEMTVVGNHYYGGGLTILMAPFFKLISNPLVLYQVCLTFCAVLQSLVAPISYHILRKYFHVKDNGYLWLAALASSFLMVTRSMVVYNEHMLILVAWVVALLFCKLISCEHNYRQKAVYTVLLMLTLSYSLTLHTRAKTYWFALVVIILLYYFMYKRWLVAKLPALLSGIAGYFLANYFIYWVKTNVWLWVEGDELKNTAVHLNLSWGLIKDPTSWEGWFGIVVGQIHTSLIFTGGFAAFAITLLAIFLWKTGKNAVLKQNVTQTETGDRSLAKPFILVLGLFFAMCIGATIFAQSLSWLFRVRDALASKPYGSNAYGFKAFTYVRYYGPYIGPFFLAAFGYIYHFRDAVKKYLPAVFSVFAILQALFIFVLLPHISNSTVASEVYWPFGLWSSFSGDAKMRTYVYLAGFLISCISFLIMLFCYWKGKFKLPLLLLCCLLVYQYVYNGIYYDSTQTEKFHAAANAGYELITDLEDQGYEVPHSLYVYDTSKQPQKYIYTYQFLLNRHQLLPEIPDASVREAIVFCSKENYDKLVSMGYQYTALDDDEFLYVKGDALLSMFQNYGLTFQK